MRRRPALLALHDVTPAHEPLLRTAWSRLESWGLPQPALLVVPNHHGRWPLSDHAAFCAELRERQRAGAEILLHGFEHRRVPGAAPPSGTLERAKARWLTAGEGEFQTLTYEETARRVREGLAGLDQAVGVRPSGFVAPAWLEGPHTRRALRDLGLVFHEDHLLVRDLRHGRPRLAPAITFTGRSRARAVASIGWARAMRAVVGWQVDLRVALHPADFLHDDLVAAIGDLLDAVSRTRRWVGYAEYLAPHAAGPRRA
jgi:hypothetical protein